MFDSLTAENQGVLIERLNYLIYGTFWLILTLWVAKIINFYSLPEKRIKTLPDRFLFQMIVAFSIFFAIEVLLFPLIIAIWFKLQGSEQLDPAVRGWLTFLAMIYAAFGILIYCYFLPKESKDVIKGPNGKGPFSQNIKNLLIGASTFCFAYPFVMVFGQIIAIIVFSFTHKVQADQTIVHHLKSILKNPLLFSATILSIVTIVPIVEEILFRGFLQSWFSLLLGRVKAIFLTSFIFACFHFSVAQGIANIELLASLFILSCFLGFIYERQQSIWASIGLHAFFNAIGVTMVFLSSNKV